MAEDGELTEEEQKRLQEMRDAEIRRMAEENRRQGVGP